MCAHVYESALVPVCVWNQKVNAVFSVASHITFESRSLPKHEVQWLARMVGQWACLPVSSLFAEVTPCTLTPSSSLRALKIQTQVFILSQQTLYQLSHASQSRSLPGGTCIQGNPGEPISEDMNHNGGVWWKLSLQLPFLHVPSLSCSNVWDSFGPWRIPTSPHWSTTSADTTREPPQGGGGS